MEPPGNHPLPPPTGPPPLTRVLRELLTVREAIRLPAASWSLERGPRGDGRTVLMVPGLGATDASLLPLRLYLRRLGHDARPVQLGRVSVDVVGQYVRVRDLALGAARSTGRPVALIGWSIGGVLAREAARDLPSDVIRVITFGTPVVGGPAHSVVGRGYDQATLRAVKAASAERNQTPLRVPITAIWSRNDGIVDPAACFDRLSPNVEHVEVQSSHFGMGLDPTVWQIIANRLASDIDR